MNWLKIKILSGYILASVLFSCAPKINSDYLKNLTAKNNIPAQVLSNYYKKALVYQGNDTRIARVMKKAQQGDSVVIGVIGGSITAGANATEAQYRWANIVTDWWKTNFPKAKVKLVNAGIGATTSLYGVHRAERDLLKYDPDFVIVEFCVNDNSNEYAAESYEGLVRKILKSKNNPGIIALSMLTADGLNAQEKHLPVLKNYGITMISQRDALKDAIYLKQGPASTWNKYSTDDVHPNNWGHAVAASVLINHLQKIYRGIGHHKQPATIPARPLTANSYERSAILTNKDLAPVQLGMWRVAYDGWNTQGERSILKFNIEAGGIIVNYKKTNKPNGGRCIVRLNGAVIDTLSADFTGGWGEYIKDATILKSSQKQNNAVEFEFIPDAGKEFYIENIMISGY